MNQSAANLNLPYICLELTTSTRIAPGQTIVVRIQGNENALTKDLNLIKTGSKRPGENCS